MSLRDLAPYIWVMWDLLAVFIIFWRVHVCAHKGFVATLVGLLVYVIAVVAAGYANKQIAAYLYDNVVREMVQNVLTHEFELVLGGVAGESANMLEAIPNILKLLMGIDGQAASALSAEQILADSAAFAGGIISAEGIIPAGGAIPTGGIAETIASQIIDSALKDPIMTALHAVSFLLVFSLVAFLMRWLSRLFIGVNSVPVIGGVNTVMGGILGLAEAALTIYVGAFVLRLVTTFSGSSWWWLSGVVINETYIWSIFY